MSARSECNAHRIELNGKMEKWKPVDDSPIGPIRDPRDRRVAAKKSALGLASARERRQRADVPLRRDVNDNRSPKKKMRLDVH